MSGGRLTEEALRQFTGGLDRYRHGLNRSVLYTEGVRYVADTAGAYWLIDAIASHIGSAEFKRAARADNRISLMHFWKLAVEPDRSAVLTAVADSGEPAFIEQAIEFTDFPLSELSVWAANDTEHWHVYLPSEH